MLKKYTVLFIILLLFLSTFFVGCKPQEKPIVPKKNNRNQSTKLVDKTDVVENSDFLEQSIDSEPEENIINNEKYREIIVNVTAEGSPIGNATVTLASVIHDSENFYAENQTDETGVAKFFIPKTITLLSATAYNKNYATVNILKQINSSESTLPISIDLILKDKGVNIIAVLVDAPEKIEGLNAQIGKMAQNSMPEIFAISTNISGTKIIFPPIPANLKNLHVSIKGKNIPRCFSRKFDTKEGENKKVIVEIPMNVTLKGTIISPDGFPVTNELTIFAMPTDRSKGFLKNGLVFNEKIEPGIDGNYEKQGFAQGFFSIFVKHPVYKNFNTNLCLLPPETELNLSFTRFPVAEFHGVVILEADNKPVEGITVNGLSHDSKVPYVSAVTDKDGKFSIKLNAVFQDNYFGEIFINEPGFGKVIEQITKKNKFIKIVLRQAGNIIGNVLNEKGEPVPNFRVSIHSQREYRSNVKKIGSETERKHVYYNTKSDDDGHYAFKNIVAPEKYKFNSGYNPEYSMPASVPVIELKPEETIEQDLIVKRPVILALKAKDKNNNPVLEYSFTHRTRIKNGSSYSTTMETGVDVSENEYFYLNTKKYGDGVFSCSAYNNEKNLSLKTNNIPFSATVTNYITLVFDAGNKNLNLSGTLLNPNGSPAENVYVSGRAHSGKGGYVSDHTDYNGDFELSGLQLKKGELMNIEANTWSTKFHVLTNLPSGTKDVILKLNPPYKLTGKVFLENLDTPAVNFVVNQNYNKQAYHSEDGEFEFKIESRMTEGNVTISAEGYLPEFVKYSFANKANCNVGNIILKKGNTGKIIGKVVTQNNKPVGINVHLWCQTVEKGFNVFASKKDGTYEFEGVPPGKCEVSAKSRLGFKATHKFNIKAGEELELPNLILNFTNSALVTFTFKLPDGSFAKNTHVNGKYIGSDGKLIRDMKTGTYSNWPMKYNGKNYVSEQFEIFESTDALEVQMLYEFKSEVQL